MILRFILIWLATISIAGAGVGIGLIFSGFLSRFNFFKSFKKDKDREFFSKMSKLYHEYVLRLYGFSGLIAIMVLLVVIYLI